MKVACDEAGHTGPDLLAADQRFFAFASVCIDDDEAWNIIEAARRRHRVQMPELKAAKLMASPRGRDLIADVIAAVRGRFGVSANEKLVALCCWLFEYVYEPVLKREPGIFYRKNLQRFVAMFAYLWLRDNSSQAPEAIRQFQKYMRSKNIDDAPALFDQQLQPLQDGEFGHPFELILRFAQGYKPEIARDNASLREIGVEGGRWVLDLSAQALWGHLNHWGRSGEPLDVQCDASKPLQAIVSKFSGDAHDPAIVRARRMGVEGKLGWRSAGPINFVDSRDHPAVQIADLVASTVVRIFSRGRPEGFETTAGMIDEGMLPYSTFPDHEVVDLHQKEPAVNYAVLYELAMRATHRADPLDGIEDVYRHAEACWTRGELRFSA